MGVEAEQLGMKGHGKPPPAYAPKLNRRFSSDHSAAKSGREHDRATNMQRDRDRKAGKAAKEERRKHDYLKSVDKGDARRGGRHKVSWETADGDYDLIGKDVSER